jgi:hypothetical protein
MVTVSVFFFHRNGTVTMSKFTKPTVQAVIRAADVAESTPAKAVRFTLPLDVELTEQIDQARKRLRQSRLAWIRQAIIEKLEREG